MKITTPTSFLSFQLNEADDGKSILVKKADKNGRIHLHDRQTKEPVASHTQFGWRGNRHAVDWHPEMLAKHPDLASHQFEMNTLEHENKTGAYLHAARAYQKAKDMGFKKTVDVHHHVTDGSNPNAPTYKKHIVSFHDAATGEKIGHKEMEDYGDKMPSHPWGEFHPNREYFEKHKIASHGIENYHTKLSGIINTLHNNVIKNKANDSHWAHGVSQSGDGWNKQHHTYATPKHTPEEASAKHEAHLKSKMPGVTIHRDSPTSFSTGEHEGWTHHSLATDGHLHHGMQRKFIHDTSLKGKPFSEKM